MSDRQTDRQTGEETDIEGKREEVSEIESDRNIGSGRVTELGREREGE